MSLLMIDLAYLGTKSLLSLGYYVAKGTYNGIAYITGNEPIKDEEKLTDKNLLAEIKSLRSEMDHLRKEIKHINEDTFLLVDPNTGEENTKVIAEICDNVSINNVSEDSDDENSNKTRQKFTKQVTL